MFFCAEIPEDIVTLLEGYPEFQKLYGEIYELCRNVEKVIGMFSKELQELDRNTVQYMMDEMQDEIDEQKAIAGGKRPGRIYPSEGDQADAPLTPLVSPRHHKGDGSRKNRLPFLYRSEIMGSTAPFHPPDNRPASSY